MKLFKFFKKRRRNEKSDIKVSEEILQEESGDLVYANYSECFPMPKTIPRPKSLQKSQSYYEEEKHIYQVFDPYAEDKHMVYPRNNFPQSHSFPLNIMNECRLPETPDSIVNSSKTSCYCPNCHDMIRPMMKSTSPRVRNMIKTNPWVNPTSQSNSFNTSHGRPRCLVSPYATSDEIFSKKVFNTQKIPDTSIDSGIFESSPHTYDITSASSCSDESIYFTTPGSKRGNHIQSGKSSAFHRVKKERYLWQPYNQTNFTFELPRSSITNYLIHSGPSKDPMTLSSHQHHYKPPPFNPVNDNQSFRSTLSQSKDIQNFI